MNLLEKLLKKLNLLDRDNCLSLTNVAYYAIVCDFVLKPARTELDVAALATVLLSYNYKRYMSHKAAKNGEGTK